MADRKDIATGLIVLLLLGGFFYSITQPVDLSGFGVGGGGGTSPAQPEPSGCSFFLDTAGGSYRARNVLNGERAYSDTVFSTVIQSVFSNIATDDTVCLNSGDRFDLTAQVTVPVSTSVFAYGATIRWTGTAPAADTAMFVNSASIAVNWYGGTIDQNDVSNVFAIGFGSSLGANPSFAVTSATIRDLRIIGILDDGLIMQHTSNTNIYIDNLYTLKSASGTNADTVEITGAGVWASMFLDQNNVAASSFTSAYLQNATLHVNGARLPLGAGTPLVGLQPFTGPMGPYIVNVDVYAHGSVVLNNGNLATGTLAGRDIRIHGQEATFFNIGTNGGGADGGGEVWRNIAVTGQWFPRTTTPLSVNSVNGLLLHDMQVDAVSVSGGLGGLFYLTSTNAMDRINDNIGVNNLVIKNIASGAVSNYFFAGNTGNRLVGNFTMYGGSIAENNVIAPANLISGGIGTVYLRIRDVQGYTNEGQGATSVADGGTISHGLVATPTMVQCTTSIASQFCSVTALAATTFTVAIKTDTGGAGTTQTIYWWAVYWP